MYAQASKSPANLSCGLGKASATSYGSVCSVSDILIIIYPIGSMYGIYANIGGILMVNVTIYSIHGSYGYIIIRVRVCVYFCVCVYICVCVAGRLNQKRLRLIIDILI